MKWITLCLILLISLAARSQRSHIDTASMLQISGVIIAENTLEPLPYTTVWNKSIRKGVISDYYGFFTMVSFPGDTLIFNFYGYASSSYIIPDTLLDNRYSIVHLMQADTLNMPEVVVHPWPSRDEFARYFVEMRPYEDAMRKAQRELSGESLAFVAAKMSNDASLAYGYAQNQRLTKLYTNGQLPANNLFNPYSWAKLVQDWKAGKLGRQ